jgi:catechol 2,3-dioxygenase-like lactoylglutathione lyase family enzyme
MDGRTPHLGAFSVSLTVRDLEASRDFTDVRDGRRQLEARGVVVATRADESGAGPAHLVVVDPDGNPILIDQHV